MKSLSVVILSSLMLTGCPIEGDDGESGINCWDSNSNGMNDPEEDINADGEWNVEDCLTTGSTPTAQNPDIAFNHQHFCEAFANLGQYPEGCPSQVHLVPTGTLTKITSLMDDGTGQAATSCYPDVGALSLTKEHNGIYWHLEGGFIANTLVLPIDDELGSNGNSCFDICQSNNECVASLSKAKHVGNGLVYECSIFYHSDTVQPWTGHCGAHFQNCSGRTGVLQVDQIWSAICP